ncbi:hypothetical protein NS228_25770 [Methylobacterium indicum]|nr:hypothetical protein NS229_20725 [Methylobacterium indicum]KTS25743.1 hypothetical protein NS228_25770 [Methylobacterium indicum]KTS44584.1 hypothetical protein NS230_25240 [Methylobacterium indicum]
MPQTRSQGALCPRLRRPDPDLQQNFPPYEAPDAPDLHLRTTVHDVETLVGQVLDELPRRRVIASSA